MTPAQAAGAIEALMQAVPAARSVILLDSHGTLLGRGDGDPGRDEILAREYAAVLQQARALAADLSWGRTQRVSVRGERGQVVFAFPPSGLTLGAETGPGAVSGQVREAVARVAATLTCG